MNPERGNNVDKGKVQAFVEVLFTGVAENQPMEL